MPFRPPVESLEPRVLMSVSKNASGWTVVGKSSDTRVIYVSASAGNDRNSGLSSSAPVKSLSKAKSLVRAGKPDWMLLKRGDAWTERLGTWTKSGRSASEPMLIGAYGSGARPLLRTGKDTGFNTNGYNVDNVAIIGLSFHAHTADPYSSAYTGKAYNAGLRIIGQSDNLLIEDCAFDAYDTNINVGPWKGNPRNITIRRSVITDAMGSGIYATGVAGLRVEQSVLDHNGWNEKTNVDGVSHNLYIQPSVTNVVVDGNIIARAGSHGVQARGGGRITNNLFYANGIGLSFGLVHGVEAKAGGVSGAIDGNVFLGTRRITRPGRGWGIAIEIGNTKRDGNTTIANNVFAHGGASQNPAIHLGYGSGIKNASQTVGLNDVTIANNVVYDWHHAIGMKSDFVAGGKGLKALNDLVVRDNQFQNPYGTRHVVHASPISKAEEKWSNNTYHDETSSSGWFVVGRSTTSLSTWRSKLESTARSKKLAYVAPNRTLETYAGATLSGTGSKTASGFLTAARKQGFGTWTTPLTAGGAITYIKAGFKA